MSPSDRHFTGRMRHAAATEFRCATAGRAAPIVARQPVFQIMEARKIFARALAGAITVGLDVMQETFRSPIRFGFIQHARESERNLEESPAIHAGKICRWRLDPIVDLESEMFVTCADECLSDCRRSFADGQRFPIFTACV